MKTVVVKVNLKDCQYGIFAMLNSSERMTVQKIGRLIRHKEPVIIIPYYRGTRDEELVSKMTDGMNTEIVDSIEQLKKLI